MKKMLIMCGAGHATSTIVHAKVNDWLKENGFENDVEIKQSAVSQEVENIQNGNYELETVQGRPSYHMITEQVKDAINKSNIANGICLVQTTHTTCSVYFDEYMHDKNYYDDDFLQVDLTNVLDKIIPRQQSENYPYLSPGPEHIAYGMKKTDPNYPAVKWTMLNTDGHLRSDFLGSNVTIGVKQHEPLLGSVGQVFFADFDQTRARKRKVEIIILGETDE